MFTFIEKKYAKTLVLSKKRVYEDIIEVDIGCETERERERVVDEF